MKKFFISHQDMDGASSIVIARILNKHHNIFHNEMYMLDYKDIDSIIDIPIVKNLETDHIIFTDITPSNIVLEYCNIHNIKISIYDHHKTFYEAYLENQLPKNTIIKYIYNVNKSGAEIFYENCFTKFVPRTKFLNEFCKLVTVYDTWQLDSTLRSTAVDLQRVFVGSLNFSNKANGLPIQEDFILNTLYKYKRMPNKFFFSLEEKKIIKKQITSEDRAFKKAKEIMKIRTDNRDDKYIYVELRSKVSLTSARLLEEYKDRVKYIVVRNQFTNDGKYSLRSLESPGFSVREIAEKWEGGGHINASSLYLEKKDDDLLRKGDIHLI